MRDCSNICRSRLVHFRSMKSGDEADQLPAALDSDARQSAAVMRSDQSPSANWRDCPPSGDGPGDTPETAAQQSDSPETFSRFRSRSEGSALGLPRKSSLVKRSSDSDESKLRRRVSFADSSGFELEQVRSFDAQPSAESEDEEDFLFRTDTTTPTRPRPSGERRFVPYFSLPWSAPGKHSMVLAALEDRKVCLETFTINSPWRMSGTILVKNLSLHKRVFVRRTLDKWRSHKDVDASFVCSVNENVDRFRFELQFAFKLPPGARLEFALGYEAGQGRGQYWDNNCECNYAFWFNDKI